VVLTGSHVDTQPSGGKFDGNYGVLAGLEVLRTLNDAGVVTKKPVGVAIWTNEEGTRFIPTMGGSGAFARVFTLDYLLAQRDIDGISFGEALRGIGYAGSTPVGERAVDAYFEAHIEQGPILEREDRVIGVVTGALGQRWYDCVWTGQDATRGRRRWRRGTTLCAGPPGWWKKSPRWRCDTRPTAEPPWASCRSSRIPAMSFRARSR
jgi:N-carbamoyl-L-amino-acid hydrolase